MLEREVKTRKGRSHDNSYVGGDGGGQTREIGDYKREGAMTVRHWRQEQRQ